MTGTASRQDIEALTDRWEEALAAHDAKALVACYAPDAVLESPLVSHIRGGPGVCRGHDELLPFFEEIVARTPDVRRFHRSTFFTDGHHAMWEYPRETADGEQMDFVEVMEIAENLIQAHRVYWGWRGVKIILDDEYDR